jgi:hypothetical protein
MDSRDNILNKMREFLITIDEEYLIGISNKGIVNRAKKDLEAVEAIKVEVEETGINCILVDGTNCFINDNIKLIKCSCPSRTICKHIIMCYLYLKSNINKLFPLENEEIEECNEIKSFNFAELLNIKVETLIQLASEKTFNEIVKRFKFGIEAIIEEGTILTINFKDEGFMVKITPRNEEDITHREIIEDSMCSCKSKDICRHKVEAIIHYEIYKGLIKKEDLKISNKSMNTNKKIYTKAIVAVKKLMEEILFVGLSRLPENIIEKLESTAILCHNSDIPSVEKQLRRVKKDIELYMKKNASFSVSSLKNIMSRIYAIALSLENCKDEEQFYKLCGEHKSLYYDIKPITLWGIGAESWSSKSGYEGITYYYFEESKEKIFTYTNSRPTYYENTKKRSNQTSYSQLPSFIPENNLEDISKYGVKLIDGKLNDEGRISSSEKSKGEILEKTDIFKLNIKSIFSDDWNQLIEKHSKSFTIYEQEQDNLCIIKSETYGSGDFNNIKQRFTMALYDKAGNEINIVLDYSKEKKKVIQKLERMDRLKKYPHSILGRIYMESGKIIIIPIASYYEDGRITNLTLE